MGLGSDCLQRKIRQLVGLVICLEWFPVCIGHFIGEIQVGAQVCCLGICGLCNRLRTDYLGILFENVDYFTTGNLICCE